MKIIAMHYAMVGLDIILEYITLLLVIFYGSFLAFLVSSVQYVQLPQKSHENGMTKP